MQRLHLSTALVASFFLAAACGLAVGEGTVKTHNLVPPSFASGDGSTAPEGQASTQCGDGIVNDAEECDDAGESDTCNADCTVKEEPTTTDPPYCGDGIVNNAEECDDAGESDTCNADCTVKEAVAPASGYVLIDHTSADLSRIPEAWIERAKQMTVHFAHTSHGSQLLDGARAIENYSSMYSIAIRRDADSCGLPSEAGALRVYDGNPPETYITPEDYWSTSGGLQRTEAVVGTGDYDISMWSWCGQASYYSEDQIRAYLSAMNRLERDHPGVRFVYMTGHTDGGGSSLARNNNLIRTFCRENGKVLFDFADIESWDPDGNHYPNTDDACQWCSSYCSANPDECSSGVPSSCAHSHGFNCKLKGQAFWWMMARLAGWPGP